MTPPESVDAIPDEMMELARECAASIDNAYRHHGNEVLVGNVAATIAGVIMADRTRNAPDTGGTSEPVAYLIEGEDAKGLQFDPEPGFDIEGPVTVTPLFLAPPAPAASPACGGEVERAGTLLDSLDRIADRLGDEGDADSKKCIRALSAEIRSALVEAQAPAAAPDAELVRRVESELPGLFWEPNERGNLGTLRIRAHATGLGEIIARNVTMEHGKLIVSAILSKHGGDR